MQTNPRDQSGARDPYLQVVETKADFKAHYEEYLYQRHQFLAAGRSPRQL